MRTTARRSRDALLDGDFAALGRAMIDNTTAQKCLHSGLISSDAQHVIEIASDHTSLGWKVNGAGGGGEVIGVVVRTRTGINPVYVSICHRISLATAVGYVLRFTPKFRLPEPIPQAHRMASADE